MSAQQNTAPQTSLPALLLFFELLFITVVVGVAESSYWLGAGAAFGYIALHAIKQTAWIVHIAAMAFWGMVAYHECGAHTEFGRMAWAIGVALVTFCLNWSFLQDIMEQAGQEH